MDHALSRSLFPPPTMALAEEVAHSRYPVLIDGQTGTGKTILAEVIHELGPRRNRPLITQGCGGLDPNLALSTLFGHERGAYTDAVRGVIGVFERADRSDLVLNDLDNLSLEAQAKLLHYFDYGEITRLGSEKVLRLDSRVIVTTNRNPEELVALGRLREDLYFRLVPHRHTLPSLAERDDVGELAKVILRNVYHDDFSGKFPACPELSDDAVEVIDTQKSWPGNCRMLKAVLLGCLSRTKAGIIGPDLVRMMIDEKMVPFAPGKTPDGVTERVRSERSGRYRRTGTAHEEKERLEAALRETRGVVSRAAEKLGMGRATFYAGVTTHQIDVDRFRDGSQ